ncbi:unnamed protein product [marine sediment metagenome]|uniref:Uncharacterized protein n=1 Tax=marine sediment metagenome TaxID=412755 RepID=X0VZP4_9ZZZZ
MFKRFFFLLPIFFLLSCSVIAKDRTVFISIERDLKPSKVTQGVDVYMVSEKVNKFDVSVSCSGSSNFTSSVVNVLFVNDFAVDSSTDKIIFSVPSEREGTGNHFFIIEIRCETIFVDIKEKYYKEDVFFIQYIGKKETT